MELNHEPINLSADEKRKYLFLKQIHTLEAFRERNAISKEQYDISYPGLISKMVYQTLERKYYDESF